MMKWKRWNKKLAAMLMGMTMLFATQTTAFAYVDEGTEATQETEATTEVVQDEHTDEEKPFSVPGNGQIQDDIQNSKNKEFLTITTKNNNTFYIVIDRSASTENVYMLSQIDENDLEKFLEEGTTEAPSNVVIEPETEVETTVTETPAIETEEPKTSTPINMGMIGILLLAGAGIAGYYYFRFYKRNQEEDDSENEGLETEDGNGLKVINEDEEELNPEVEDLDADDQEE